MIAESFNRMVAEPAQINDNTVAELRVLTERYPYCQAGQILLARKLFVGDSPAFEQQLRRTAMAVYDREKLYLYIHQPAETAVLSGQDDFSGLTVMEIAEPEPVIVPDPVTEVTPVTVEETSELLNELIEEIPEILHREEDTEIPLPELEEEKIDATALLTEETVEIPEPQAVEPGFSDTGIGEEQTEPKDLLGLYDTPVYDIERELGPLAEEDKFTLPPVPEEEEAQNTEVQTDTFAGWLFRLGGAGSGRIVEMKEANAPIRVYLRQVTGNKEAPVSERLMNEQVAAEMARNSLRADEGLVSETYARILVMQGKNARAIEMYQRLRLLKPQKSDYFAALIEQIKKR